MTTSFYSQTELLHLGLKHFGSNVLISRKASFYSPETIEIGDNVRIDDFCILSGVIKIGSNIHISAYSALYGALGIVLDDYCGMSPRSTIYSAMDDFNGDYLIGPIHNLEMISVKGGLVRVKKYAHIGANSVVFPGVTIEEGTVIGAMSLVKQQLPAWTICAGIPAHVIKARSNGLLKFLL